MGVPPPACRCERALCCRRLYAWPRPRFALSGSSGGNWPRSAHMLRVGSVVPGGCGVAILWRLYGDEDGPLRTSPNLSLRWFLSSHVSRSRALVDSFSCNCEPTFMALPHIKCACLLSADGNLVLDCSLEKHS